VTAAAEPLERFPDCPWVFFRHDTGKPIRDFRDAWDAANKAAGLWEGDAEKGTRRNCFTICGGPAFGTWSGREKRGPTPDPPKKRTELLK